MNPAQHYEIDELMGYFRETLAAEAQASMELHFADCPSCTNLARSVGVLARVLERWEKPDGREAPAVGVASALRSLAKRVEQGSIHERLVAWFQRWDGKAEGAVRLAIDHSINSARIFTEGLAGFLRPGARWEFANDLIPAAPVRGSMAENPIAIAVAPGALRAVVAVSSEASEIEVRIDGLPESGGRLVVLIPEDQLAGAQVRETILSSSGNFHIAHFGDVKPGRYFIVFEPFAHD